MTCVESSRFPSTPRRTRSSMAERKAARVLPDPVGAAINVCRCFLISGQACNCGSVGAGKVRANQRATAGWNSSRFIRDEYYNLYDLFELLLEFLKLRLQLLDFSSQRFDALFETCASLYNTLRGFGQSFDIDLARKQMSETTFLLSRLARQTNDQRLRLARDQSIQSLLNFFETGKTMQQ